MKVDPKIQALFSQAVQAREKAYAPYSRFQVGAALETAEGQIYAACNVENGSYGLSLCAEQSVIAKAISEGHRSFHQILVAAHPLATPCGACRQVISEFIDEEGQIYAVDAKNPADIQSWTLSELLPARFRFGTDPRG